MGKITDSAQTDCGLLLSGLINLLQEIKELGDLAKLNETTISDNNGGRITL